MKIAVIGAGAFGTALGDILVSKGHDVDYYDPRNEKSLDEVLVGAEYVVLAAPSKAVPLVLPALPKTVPLIVATKGLLSDQIFKDFDDYMVLSGPGFASDIKAKNPTKLTMTDQRIEELFGTDYLSFDYIDDTNGVLMCGALKNVYAILAGLLNLERDSGDWRHFVDVVLEEMRKILEINGANPKTVDLACGIGDLELTCGYPSRNYEFGDMLSKNPNYTPEKTVEGVSALERIKLGDIKLPDDVPYLNDLIARSEKWV